MVCIFTVGVIGGLDGGIDIFATGVAATTAVLEGIDAASLLIGVVSPAGLAAV